MHKVQAVSNKIDDDKYTSALLETIWDTNFETFELGIIIKYLL